MVKDNYFLIGEIACLAFLFFNVLDIESTIFALDQGLIEGNPAVDSLGFVGHWLFKIGTCLMMFIPVYVFADDKFFQFNYAFWVGLAALFFMHISFSNFLAGIVKMWGF